MVSGGIIALLFICGGLCTVLPFVAMAVFKAKNKDVKISSFFIGCGVFVLFALILEQLLHTVMLPLVRKSTVMYVIYGILAAGIFEETGRFAAFKTVMKNRNDPKEAVMFGLGHGGAEAILLAGLSLLSTALTAVMLNNVGFEELTAMSSGGNAETAELVRSQLSAVSELTAVQVVCSLLERIISMTFHTAMSVIVFESARVKGKLWLFPASILLHAICDLPAALYQRQVIPMWAVYPIMAVITAGIVWLAVRSFGRTRELCGEKGA